MFKKGSVIMMLILSLIFGLAGCSSNGQSADKETTAKTTEPAKEEPAKPYEIKLYVTAFGSIGYNQGNAVAEVVKKYNPKLKITVVESLGISDSVKQTQLDPKGSLAYAGSGYRLPVSLGLPPLTAPAKIQALFATMETGFTIMSGDPNIKTVTDMNGKRVSVGTPAAFYAFPKYLDELGLKFSQTVNLSHDQGKDAIIDGKIDAAIATFSKVGDKWGASPAATELLKQKKGSRLVSVPKEANEKIRAKYPEVRYAEAPAGSFGEWQTEPLGVFYQNNGIFAHPDFPADIAYELVKTIAEHSTELKGYHASLGAMDDPKFMASFPKEFDFADYHPGAIKYYQEKSLMK